MVALSCSSSITHSSIKPPFHSSVVTITPIPCNCTSINFTQMITHPIIIEKTSRFPAIRGKFYPKFCAINPHQTSSTTHLGNWEDPVSSDSETDEEDDIEENNLDFESDWEEEKDASETQINIESLSTSQIEEDLKKGLSCYYYTLFFNGLNHVLLS